MEAKNKYFSSLLLLLLAHVLEVTFNNVPVARGTRAPQRTPFACPGRVFIDVSEGSYPSAVLSVQKHLLQRNMRRAAGIEEIGGAQTLGASYELGNYGSEAHILNILTLLLVMPVTTKTLYWPWCKVCQFYG